MKTFMAAITITGMIAASVGVASAQSASTSTATYKGSAIDPATLASFKAGATTLDQVIATLGKPVGAVRTPSGNEVIAYVKIRKEDVDNDRTPETGTALPKRHKIRYATMLSFDPQGHWLNAWTRVDDLGDASPSALGHFEAGDVLTNQGGMP